MPNAAKLIKLADRIDNIKSLDKKDKSFKKLYLYETCGLIWAIIGLKSRPSSISSMFGKLMHACYNAESHSEPHVSWTNIQKVWEQENSEKIAKYGY